MMLRLPALAFIAISAIGGCALDTGARNDVPAIIAQPTAATRAEVQNALSTALGMSITLANDALTHSSTLSIERNPIYDSSGRRIEVRERAPPELFRLIKRGSQCVLIRERTQTESALRVTQCVPE
jgi:hypothetical protein